MNSIWDKIISINWWRWLSIVFMGISVRFTIDVIFGLKYRNYQITWDSWEYFKAVILALIVLEGIRWINRRHDESLSWESNPYQRIGLQISTNILFVILIINGSRVISAYIFDSGSSVIILDNEAIVGLTATIYTLLIILVEVGTFFLKRWRRSSAELERFKKENIQFQFEMLRAQVNPHFLFNSLNTLAGLIYSQQDMAGKFVRQLSRVYRNVIKNREKEVIQLREELGTLKAYLDLMELRFGPNLITEIEVHEEYESWYIAPMILQMLIENSVKHNVVTEKKPLRIRVYVDENDYLVVQNNLQLKINIRTPSGAGLSNIISRYSYIIDKEVQISSDNNVFTVKVPILKKEYESPNY